MTRVTCASCPELDISSGMTCPGQRHPGQVEPAAYQPPNGLGPVMVLMRLGSGLEQGRKPVEDGDQEQWVGFIVPFRRAGRLVRPSNRSQLSTLASFITLRGDRSG